MAGTKGLRLPLVNQDPAMIEDMAERLTYDLVLVEGPLGFADLGAGYDYLDATDTETGQDLPYRANHKANASIGAGGAGQP